LEPLWNYGHAFLSRILSLSDDDQVANSLDLLARLIATDQGAAELAVRIVSTRHRELVDRAERQAVGTLGHRGRLSLLTGLWRLLTGSGAEGLTAAEPGNTIHQRDLWISYIRLGDLAREAGQTEEARQLYHEGMRIADRLLAAEPENDTHKRDLLVSYVRLGMLNWTTGTE
jgi:hypothetical protein